MSAAARALIAICLALLIVYGAIRARPTGELRDFGSFYASGLAARDGLNPYAIHPLTFHVVLPGFEIWNPNLNPPISVLFFRLLTSAPPDFAFRLWWVFSLLCYIAAVALLVRRYTAHARWLPALWALALAGLWDSLALGQIYLPLVLAAVAAWTLLESGKHAAAGVLIGVVVAVKPNFAVWPVLLLLAGHFRPSIVAAVTVAVLSAVPLLAFGADIYRQWIAVILADGDRARFLTNASIAGLFKRIDAGALGVVSSAVLLVALAGWAFARRPAARRASALGLLGGIAASPIAWVHYTLCLLPVFFTEFAGRPSWLLAGSAALLVVPVGVTLRFLDAPFWQQITAGSVYNWATLLCLAGITLWSRQPGAYATAGVEATAHKAFGDRPAAAVPVNR